MEDAAPAPEADDKDASAHAIEQAKRDLETQIERAVANHEQQDGDESLEVSLNFEGTDLSEGGDEAGEALRREIRSLVEQFHQASAIEGSGIHVQRLTAIDSDADGEVAVRVDYDYAGYQ